MGMENYWKSKYNNGPCKDCTMRRVGCHATCEQYLKYKEEWLNFKSIVRKAHRHEGYFQMNSKERTLLANCTKPGTRTRGSIDKAKRMIRGKQNRKNY